MSINKHKKAILQQMKNLMESSGCFENVINIEEGMHIQIQSGVFVVCESNENTTKMINIKNGRKINVNTKKLVNIIQEDNKKSKNKKSEDNKKDKNTDNTKYERYKPFKTKVKDKNLTQRELADKLDVHPSTVSRWGANSETPSSRTPSGPHMVELDELGIDPTLFAKKIDKENS